MQRYEGYIGEKRFCFEVEDFCFEDPREKKRGVDEKTLLRGEHRARKSCWWIREAKDKISTLLNCYIV